MARAGVERWERHVRSLPSAAVLEEHRLALRSLVAWYERVCVDERFVGPAPETGIEALSLIEGSHVHPDDDPFVIAEGAVRIAVELVDYRKLLDDYLSRLRSGELADPEVEQCIRWQLDEATESVCEFLDWPC